MTSLIKVSPTDSDNDVQAKMARLVPKQIGHDLIGRCRNRLGTLSASIVIENLIFADGISIPTVVVPEIKYFRFCCHVTISGIPIDRRQSNHLRAVSSRYTVVEHSIFFVGISMLSAVFPDTDIMHFRFSAILPFSVGNVGDCCRNCLERCLLTQRSHRGR